MRSLSWKRAAVLSLLILLSAAVRGFFGSFSGLFGSGPDGLLALTVAVAMIYDPMPSLLFGFFAGALCDIPCGSYGHCAVFYAASGLLSSLFFSDRDKKAVYAVPAAFALSLAKWLFRTVTAYFGGMKIDFYASLVRSFVPQAIFTAIAALVFAWLMLAMSRLGFMTRNENNLKY